MLRRKKTKIAALLLSLAMFILLFTDISPYDVGIYVSRQACSDKPTVTSSQANLTCRLSADCSSACHLSLRNWSARNFTYHFFHVGALHLFLNLWCFLSCVFLADMSAGRLFAAYLIACTAPALSPVPTVGFSGVCFAILGFVMWQSKNKLEYNAYVLLGIVLPLVVVPHAVNNLLHLYCYAVAVILGALQRLRRLTVFGLFVPFGLFVLSDL